MALLMDQVELGGVQCLAWAASCGGDGPATACGDGFVEPGNAELRVTLAPGYVPVVGTTPAPHPGQSAARVEQRAANSTAVKALMRC